MTNTHNAQTGRGSLFTLLVFVAIALTLVLDVLSANIRLADIGIGCSNWPACFGKVGATADDRIAKSLVAGGSVLPHEGARIFHRLAASLLGFLVFIITYLSLFRRSHTKTSPILVLLVLALTVFLSVLGIMTPSLLVPAVTLGNVLGGMAILALLWWIGQRSLADRITIEATAGKLRPWAIVGLIVVMTQIALGAWTSGSFAGPACTALPACGEGAWTMAHLAEGFNPARVLAVDNQGKIIADATMNAIHMVHRLGALLAFVYLGGLGISTLRKGGTLRTTGIAICILLTLQVGLGLIAVVSSLPLIIVTAHNAIAALLLLSIINLNHLLTSK